MYKGLINLQLQYRKEKVSKVNKSGTKSIPEFLPPYFYFNIFAYTAFFHFPNQIQKLKALDQPQVQAKKIF